MTFPVSVLQMLCPVPQAVVDGKWVVVENINMAPPDVLAALVPLLESRKLHVPSRGQVLIATLQHRIPFHVLNQCFRALLLYRC